MHHINIVNHVVQYWCFLEVVLLPLGVPGVKDLALSISSAEFVSIVERRPTA